MPSISPGALQMLLPFMKTLGKSAKAEQPVQIAEGLRYLAEGTGKLPTRLIEGYGAVPAIEQGTPWDRLAKMVRQFKGNPQAELHVPPNEHGLYFGLRRPSGSEWEGAVGPDARNPFELYVQHLSSDASRRKTVGNVGSGMETYSMDITSPAQRRWTGRGFDPKPNPAERVHRDPEERMPLQEFKDLQKLGYNLPGPSSAEKQQLMDRLLDMARQSGFKKLTFSAEPGERPRLYSKLMGYEAKPTGESGLDQISRLMRGLPGRQAAMSDREVAPHVQRMLTSNEAVPAHIAENILGLSLDEGIDYGFIQPAGQGLFRLTPEGRRSAEGWMRGQQ